MNSQLLHWMAERESIVVPTLFKPVQFEVLKKIDQARKLNDNEKRYLRGKIKDKLNVLDKVIQQGREDIGLRAFLNTLNSYYITGLEALKHNGYGWYFDPKIIEVINTKVEGKITVGSQTLKLIRVKSIKNSDIHKDKESGLRYAKNEQIKKDTIITKNNYTKNIWNEMYSRYGKIFAKSETNNHAGKIDYAIYGV